MDKAVFETLLMAVKILYLKTIEPSTLAVLGKKLEKPLNMVLFSYHKQPNGIFYVKYLLLKFRDLTKIYDFALKWFII